MSQIPAAPASDAITSCFDHFVIGASTLELGQSFLCSSVGVMPRYSGVHPNQGTCNALLGLESDAYLEVLAPDPDQDATTSHIRQALTVMTKPAFSWWAVRCANLEGAAHALAALGVKTSAIAPGSRRTPSGDHIAWRLLFIDAQDLGGAVPFLIDWGRVKRPPTLQPICGSLRNLEVFHPQAHLLRAILDAIGFKGRIVLARRPLPSMTLNLFALAGSSAILASGDPFPPPLYSHTGS